MPEITWIAHYRDGSRLVQSDSLKYSMLDRSNLQAFDLCQDGYPFLRVDLRDDGLGHKALVWRTRTIKRSDGLEIKVHIAGWQRNGQTVANYVVDGMVILGQSMNDIFMDEVVPFPWETDLIRGQNGAIG